jgi:hypothetical protein
LCSLDQVEDDCVLEAYKRVPDIAEVESSFGVEEIEGHDAMLVKTFNCNCKRDETGCDGGTAAAVWRERETSFSPDLRRVKIAFYKNVNLRDMSALSAEKAGDFKLACA